MVLSMRDRWLFPLSCNHSVVIGRLEGRDKWKCEHCGQETDLSSGEFRTKVEKDIDTVHQIDLQEQEKGHTVTRAL